MLIVLIPDGFPGQRLRVLAKPLVKASLKRPITNRLLVTDAGYFHHASAHGRSRPHGVSQAVVIVCVNGTGWLRTEKETARVDAGDVVVIPPDIPHLYWADDADPWTIWWLHAEGEDVSMLVDAIAVDASYVLRARDIYTATSLIEQAVNALERDETVNSLYEASGAAWNLLARLASDRLRGRPDIRNRIHIVQDFLRQNLAAQTTVSELARLADLSNSHFSALFKASAGFGVVEYVKRLRSARARELLINTEASISEIARSVGYTDAFYFSRQFRSVNGVSPSDYRDSFRHDVLVHPSGST